MTGTFKREVLPWRAAHVHGSGICPTCKACDHSQKLDCLECGPRVPAWVRRAREKALPIKVYR